MHDSLTNASVEVIDNTPRSDREVLVEDHSDRLPNSRSRSVSLSGRFFRSEDLMGLQYSHIANRSKLAIVGWNLVAAWEYCLSLCQQHVLGFRFLGHLLSFASSCTYLTDVHVLLRWRRVFLCQDGQ